LEKSTKGITTNAQRYSIIRFKTTVIVNKNVMICNDVYYTQAHDRKVCLVFGQHVVTIAQFCLPRMRENSTEIITADVRRKRSKS